MLTNKQIAKKKKKTKKSGSPMTATEWFNKILNKTPEKFDVKKNNIFSIHCIHRHSTAKKK